MDHLGPGAYDNVLANNASREAEKANNTAGELKKSIDEISTRVDQIERALRLILTIMKTSDRD